MVVSDWGRIRPVTRDIGAFSVQRVLPSATRRSVGPFVFFDQMGPAAFAEGEALDVRPHPHIGLATITWLIEGEIDHRDSLGFHQPIRPGEVNWMTAGRGVVHSERSPAHERRAGARLFGIQTWVALPQAHEEIEPSFVHYPADQIPWVEEAGVRAALVVGEAWGGVSPVATPMQTFYADIALAPGASIEAPVDVPERAVWLIEGEIETPAGALAPGEMLTAPTGAAFPLTGGAQGARLIAIGGEPLDAPRRMWWNFVSHSAERIEQAKADWREGRFPPVPGDDEFIPLPER